MRMRWDWFNRFDGVKKLVKPLAWTLAPASLIHPLAYWLAWIDWRADLITHFREPALAVSLVGSLALISRSRRLALGLGLLALWQAWGLTLCYWPNPVPPQARSRERLRVLTANLLVDNNDRERLIQLVREERPDVVGLIEVTSGWIAGLETIRSEYSHRFEYPFDEDGQGIALWMKKQPLSVERFSSIARGGIPAIHAVIDFAGKPRDLWVLHFRSPLLRNSTLPIGREFEALASIIQRQGGSSLVVGDFNSTDGSPHFWRFLESSGLRDSRLGFGRQGSWPTWIPYRIGIDHAFLSNDLAVADRRLGSNIGSDHFPLIIDVAPSESSATNRSAQDSHSTGSPGSSDEANLARSACWRNVASFSRSDVSSFSARTGSAPISSVVFEPQPGPKASIKASRTSSDALIHR